MTQIVHIGNIERNIAVKNGFQAKVGLTAESNPGCNKDPKRKCLWLNNGPKNVNVGPGTHVLLEMSCSAISPATNWGRLTVTTSAEISQTDLTPIISAAVQVIPPYCNLIPA